MILIIPASVSTTDRHLRTPADREPQQSCLISPDCQASFYRAAFGLAKGMAAVRRAPSGSTPTSTTSAGLTISKGL